MNELTVHLPTWERLLKDLLWPQLEGIRGMRILDFGSGNGATAAYLAQCNNVTAIEPDAAMLDARYTGFTQLIGGVELLHGMPDGCLDAVICHNVLEYVDNRPAALQELVRVLKPGGVMSIVKHNRAGRVMQMAVLLSDFDKANALLDGEDGCASRFGAIHYYEDDDVARWCPGLKLEACYGLRTFWDLQQNQQIQQDEAWQAQMLKLEARVAKMPEYRAVAFFHHLMLHKR